MLAATVRIECGMRNLLLTRPRGGVPTVASAQTANPLVVASRPPAQEITPQVVTWRRDFHKNPELGNREVRTAKVIADELRRLGLRGQDRRGAHRSRRGAQGRRQPGPVVALRSDMDALPVTEQGDLPFKSTAKAPWNGQEVGVMHACGHDNHMAILLGAATVFAQMKDQLPRIDQLIFQPAEEGPPASRAAPS